jgi:uncharacterized protein YyaL (SSP411 family)
MSTTEQQHPNRLIHETSPYLLQHAYNPVDWYPWGDEALQKARQEDKPILLSIGYSACHWCHVMAHESFEDPATAQVMNELFVNIKVDREERPDLDKIYQFSHQLLTQRGGGWPLTMILMPQDQTPFFAGTYFPNQARHGMPPFTDILRRVAQYYHQRPDDLDKQNDSLRDILQQVSTLEVDPQASLDPAPLDQSRHQLAQSYDGLYGGFGDAPKFPHPTNVERLLRHWHATAATGTADLKALDMASTTLKCMALGGIYDQIGGGFCRYSVDQEWMIPHFEKMLYDNGPLLALYAQAWQATGEPLFQRIAAETGEWVMREMQAPEGGYYSSLDADSEGEEGKFYVWSPEEIKNALAPDEYQVLARHYRLLKKDGAPAHPNFEGRWNLHTDQPLTEVAKQLSLTETQAQELLSSAKQTLFRLREQRVRPGRDEKILTAWNGLMIKGMALAGRVLQREDFVDSAERALDFIRGTLWREEGREEGHDGRLLVTYKDGKAHLVAYLDDYAFLLDGILELLQARWRDEDMIFAIELAEAMLAHFEDAEQGAFFFTADDHEQLIQRNKPLMDEAIPAGNGIAAFTLQRLGHVLGETRYLQAAERTLKAAWQSIQRTPYAHNALLLALEEYLYPTETVILRGGGDELEQWRRLGQQDYVPRRLVLAIPEDARQLPGILKNYENKGANVTAYVCAGQQCSVPVTALEPFKQALKIT